MANTLEKALRSLSQLLRDSRDGYKKCAEDVADATLRDQFTRLAETRESMLQELQSEAKSIDKESEVAETSGSTLSVGHRLFVDLKSLVSGGDKNAILNEVERGENYLIDQYQQILDGDYDLPALLKSLLQQQLAKIRDELDSLKKQKS